MIGTIQNVGRGLGATTLLAMLAMLASPAAHAVTITDPAGDFIPSFQGTPSGNLDVLSFSATYDGTTFHFGATLNGPVNNPPTSLYVIGVNRGRGNLNFAAIGLPNITFDAVVTLTGAGALGGVAAPGSGSSFTISGNTFTINVPGSALPSLGRDPSNYLVNLWPRDGAAAAGNGQISDFAPNSADIQVPEPLSLALLATGLVGLLVTRHRRRAASDGRPLR